ncbi:site-specific integrase [Desulfosporosinus sp. FKA]|uniref:site-specific integrase n=1 Tax=Desulfosporosinus sp. FKA TaxID=1969834 RepID=UPI001124D941|nr:site-specific integrase [Desulfosporosinus sp. FKA]
MEKTKILHQLMFAPYRYAWAEENGTKHEWCLISIELNGIMLRLTDFHKYIGAVRGSRHAYYLDNDSVRRACNFLTYALFIHHSRYKVDRITDIPFQSAVDYMNEYSRTKNYTGNYPSRQSVEKERNAVCHFMKNIGNKRSDYKTHYYVKKVLVKESAKNKSPVRKRTIKTIWEYEIDATYLSDEPNNLIRDIPQKAIPIILRAIRREAPDLLFGALLQLFAGLREGEAVNVRRANSIYYGGIRYVKENGKFTSFEVDLTKEYLLRSDGKTTGNIKRERTQAVYPIFLDAIQEAYEAHLKLVNADDIEPEAPMFVNMYRSSKTGKKMALSKQSYCKRIKEIMFNTVVPELLKSDDRELKTYGMLLNENNWGLHAFRHWFTVQLVLNGEDLDGIAFWRGDTSLQTAYTYLQNKGEIMKKYQKANDIVANKIINRILMEGF